jgi:hypothetical protein
MKACMYAFKYNSYIGIYRVVDVFTNLPCICNYHCVDISFLADEVNLHIFASHLVHSMHPHILYRVSGYFADCDQCSSEFSGPKWSQEHIVELWTSCCRALCVSGLSVCSFGGICMCGIHNYWGIYVSRSTHLCMSPLYDGYMHSALPIQTANMHVILAKQASRYILNVRGAETPPLTGNTGPWLFTLHIGSCMSTIVPLTGYIHMLTVLRTFQNGSYYLNSLPPKVWWWWWALRDWLGELCRW